MASDEPQNPSTEALPSVEDLLKPGTKEMAAGMAPLGSAIGKTGQTVDAASPDPLDEPLPPDVDIDELLSSEDPDFAKRLQDIQASEFSKDVDIEALDIENFLEEGERSTLKKVSKPKTKLTERIKNSFNDFSLKVHKMAGRIKVLLRDGSKVVAKKSVSSLLALLKFLFGFLKKSLVWIKDVPTKVKLNFLASCVLAAAAFMTVKITLRGSFLPSMQSNFLTSFADHADESFDYSPTDPKETFESEIRHPEHIYEMEKIVVNLKQEETLDHTPMGLFEFYIECNSQDAVVELGDRSKEARHTIERVLEQLTYDELREVSGKNKMKIILRKQLSAFLSKGHQVRQIYIKTFVLKP